jgi:ligand-binding sensor domain-containing protein
MVHYILTGCLILTGCSLSYGQTVRMISLKRFTEADGLSSYYITKIVQDAYGYLWVGTQSGLDRFNGTAFSVFGPRSAPDQQLEGNVSDLVEDRARHQLWVATSSGDLCAISTLTATITRRVLLDAQGKPWTQKWLKSLCLAGDILWIGTSQGLYGYRITDGRFLLPGVQPGHRH